MSYRTKRSRSRSKSASKEIPQFPLILAFSKDKFTGEFTYLLETLFKKCKIDRIHIASETNLNNFDNGIIYIYGSSASGKFDVLKNMCDHFIKYQESPELSVKMLVPDSILRTLTNKYGNRLNGLQGNSQVRINLLKEITGLRERVIKLQGRPSDIGFAIKSVYFLILDFQDVPKKRSTLDRNSPKFVIPGECVGFFIGRQGSFIKWIKSEYDIDIKVVKNEGPPCKQDDHIIVLLGRTRYAIRSFKSICSKIIEAIESLYNTSADLSVKLLIHKSQPIDLSDSSFVLKDIGKRTGARIKVTSEIENDRFKLVAINSSIDVKIDTAERIYEYITRERR